jgi:hypothetical protein
MFWQKLMVLIIFLRKFLENAFCNIWGACLSRMNTCWNQYEIFPLIGNFFVSKSQHWNAQSQMRKSQSFYFDVFTWVFDFLNFF